jgi:hypothetical protein
MIALDENEGSCPRSFCKSDDPSAGKKSMFTTIAILMVGCFVVNAVVLSLAYFTDGARAAPVLAPTSARLERRVRRQGRT